MPPCTLGLLGLDGGGGAAMTVASPKMPPSMELELWRPGMVILRVPAHAGERRVGGARGQRERGGECTCSGLWRL